MNVQRVQFNQNVNNSGNVAFGFKSKLANTLADKIIEKYGCRSLPPRIHNAIVELNVLRHPEIKKEVEYFRRLRNIYTKFGDDGWIREADVPNSCKGYDEKEYLIIEKGRKPQIVSSDVQFAYAIGEWRPEPMSFMDRIKNFFFGQKEYKIVKIKQ